MIGGGAKQLVVISGFGKRVVITKGARQCVVIDLDASNACVISGGARQRVAIGLDASNACGDWWRCKAACGDPAGRLRGVF